MVNYSADMKSFSRYKAEISRPVGIVDRDRTLAAWHDRARRMKTILDEAQSERDDKLKRIAADYAGERREREAAKVREDYQTLVKLAKETLLEHLQDTLSGKRSQLAKMTVPPTADMVNLLTVTAMRDSIDASDMAAIAGQLRGNLHALAALRDIAKKKGIHTPGIPTLEDIENQITDAETMVTAMMESIAKPVRELTYKERCFWTLPADANPNALYFEALDTQNYTAATKTQTRELASVPEANKRYTVPEGKKPNAIMAYLNGSENLSVIAAQFGVSLSELKASNPDINPDRIDRGQILIIPGTPRMKYMDTPGSLAAEQCDAAYIEQDDNGKVIVKG